MQTEIYAYTTTYADLFISDIFKSFHFVIVTGFFEGRA